MKKLDNWVELNDLEYYGIEELNEGKNSCFMPYWRMKWIGSIYVEMKFYSYCS